MKLADKITFDINLDGQKFVRKMKIDIPVGKENI